MIQPVHPRGLSHSTYQPSMVFCDQPTTSFPVIVSHTFMFLCPGCPSSALTASERND